jgi:hypothetical protein
VDTIQGTDIGIPKDSIVISEIHAENMCDGASLDCVCMQPIKLTRDDFQSVLLDLTSTEKRQVRNLRQLCLWGLLAIWGNLNENDELSELVFGDHTNESIQVVCEDTDVNLLQQSFTELIVSDGVEGWDEAVDEELLTSKICCKT